MTILTMWDFKKINPGSNIERLFKSAGSVLVYDFWNHILGNKQSAINVIFKNEHKVSTQKLTDLVSFYFENYWIYTIIA